MSEARPDVARATLALVDAPPARPLRLGLLVDGYVLPAWVERMLRTLVEQRIAEVSLVVLNAGPSSEAGPHGEAREPGDDASRAPGARGRIAGWWRNRDVLPYALFSRIDGRRYPAGEQSAHRPVDLAPLLASIPVVRVQPRQTKFSDFFPDDQLAEIRAHELDVALRLGFRILKGGALAIARHGVWSFHHGDNRVNRGGPAGVWEVLLGEPTTGATLQILTEDLDGGRVVARSLSSTNPVSPTTNRENFYWQAAELLVAGLRRLQVEGASPDASDGGAWTAYDRRLFVAPAAAEMLWLWPRVLFRLVRRKLRALLVREHWFIAYRLAPTAGARPDVPDGTMYRYRELASPADRYWADPFPVAHEGRHWIFYEEHFYGSPHAHINVMEVGPQGPVGAPTTVVRRDYHLSYPAVFRWNGDWWMTPETADQRRVQLLRATRFPFEWEHHGDLLQDVVATDPTIAEIDGRWWLFVGAIVPGATEATALNVYWADSPLGPWRPHARNPVKIDVRGARPAGRLFQHDGAWYRPAQDGAPAYGSAIVVHRLEVLTPTEFREREVQRIEPRWRPGLVGTHTLNASGRLSVLDAREVRSRFRRRTARA